MYLNRLKDLYNEKKDGHLRDFFKKDSEIWHIQC